MFGKISNINEYNVATHIAQGYMQSNEDVSCPNEATKWKEEDSDSWSSQATVECDPEAISNWAVMLKSPIILLYILIVA